MTGTITSSRSGTFTAARVRDVMFEVHADLIQLVSPGLISMETAKSWAEDLTYILERQAAKGFQLQFRCSGHEHRAVDYRVSEDGTLHESSTSGGINYFALPRGTQVILFVFLDFQARSINEVNVELAKRGWGSGQAIEGAAVRDRAYSKDGYGLIRAKIGAWQ